MKYNCHIGFLAGVEKCPSGQLFDTSFRHDVASVLKDEGCEALRFPGGSYHKRYKHDINVVQKWIGLCLNSGVINNAFVININDPQDSLLSAVKISEALNIELFELGNEEYFREFARPRRWKKWEFINSVYYFNLGVEYAEKCKTAIQLFSKDFPDAKFAPCLSKSNNAWNKGVQSVMNFTDVVIHVYPDFNEIYPLTKLDKQLKKFDFYNIHFTEVNVKYPDYSSEHKMNLKYLIEFLTRRSNTKNIYLHSLWGNHRFERFGKRDGEFIDYYKNWLT